MKEVFVQSGCFSGAILLGYLLRRFGFFKDSDFHMLSRLVSKVTLTAAIVVNFNGRTMERSLLFLPVLGFAAGALHMLFQYLGNRSKGQDAQVFGLINLSGTNIGNFAMPFAQGFLGAAGVVAVCFYDIGNAFITLGLCTGVASGLGSGGKGIDLRALGRSLVRSIPLDAYVVMTVLCILRLTLPGPLVQYAQLIANSNAFLSMLMIGVGFHIGSREQLPRLARYLLLRYGAGLAFALIAWLLLPLDAEIRLALVIVFLAPIPAIGPAYTAEFRQDYGLASVLNSLSIVLSIVLISGAMILCG